MFTNHQRLGCNPFSLVTLLRTIPWQCRLSTRAGNSSYPRTRSTSHDKPPRSSAPRSQCGPPLRATASPGFPDSCSSCLSPLPSSQLLSCLHQELLLLDFYDSTVLLSLAERVSSRAKALSRQQQHGFALQLKP